MVGLTLAANNFYGRRTYVPKKGWLYSEKFPKKVSKQLLFATLIPSYVERAFVFLLLFCSV